MIARLKPVVLRVAGEQCKMIAIAVLLRGEVQRYTPLC